MIQGSTINDGMMQSRRGICSTCQDKEALYTCPGCYINSCSISCIKQHKDDTGCTGIRDKVAFVSIKEYNASHLLSDYRFLEELDRRNNSARRHLQQHVPQSNIEHRRKDIKMTAQRRRVQFEQLPIHFSRSKRNNTFCRYRYLNWTVELTFVHSGVKFIEDGVYENTPLEKVLQQVLDDPIKRQRLKLYVEGGGLEKMKVLMKSKNYHDIDRRGFYALDITKSVQDNLRGNYVIEFPEFLIILEDRLSDYKIMVPNPVKPTDPIEEMLERKYRGKRGRQLDQEAEAKKRKLAEEAAAAAGKKDDGKKDDAKKDDGSQDTKDQPDQQKGSGKPSEVKGDEATGSESKDKGETEVSEKSDKTEESQGKDDSN